jgi:lipopolysaccharide/colanic/teichoic acid biosynthesis glycosyltransferase/acyl carrier protein
VTALRITRYNRVKRALDVIAGGVGLVVTSPVLAVVAGLVAIKLGRPVLFEQDRPGLHGQVFRLYKFRTMRSVDPAQGLIADEDRLTPFGHVLRSTSLDELPTLVNVLRGDMSIVGPRPLLVQYLSRYTTQQARRHEVRPGVTGLAQVSGRNALNWDDKFALDVEYVDKQGIALDAWILWRTLTAVIKRQGISGDGVATMVEFTGHQGQICRKTLLAKGNSQMEQAQFIELVEETLEVDTGTVTFADKLDHIDWDSLANIGFIAAVDTKFGVSMDAERLARSETVSDLYDLLQDAISAK